MPRGRPKKRALTPVSSSGSDNEELDQLYVKELCEPDENEGEGQQSDRDWYTEDDDATQDDEEDAGRRSGAIDVEWVATRAIDIFATCDEAKPPLILPTCSSDLNIDAAHLLDALCVYETVKRFSVRLRLTAFIFEDFCAALAYPATSALLNELHTCLVKEVFRDEERSGTQFGPGDVKDSINLSFHLVDPFTLSELLRAFFGSEQQQTQSDNNSESESDSEEAESEPTPKLRQSSAYVEAYGVLERCTSYPYDASVADRLVVLRCLTDVFLATASVRTELYYATLDDHRITYDDNCRVCNRGGDLLCCETCSAVYHLDCVDPPLFDIPNEEWRCTFCVQNDVHGVSDCLTAAERAGVRLCRQEPLGYDRFGRSYWFLARRIVVEGTRLYTAAFSSDGLIEPASVRYREPLSAALLEDHSFVDSEHDASFNTDQHVPRCCDVRRTVYYSTIAQLELLVEVLDESHFESGLVRSLRESFNEIARQMTITDELTAQSLPAGTRSILELESVRARHETMQFVEHKEAGTLYTLFVTGWESDMRDPDRLDTHIDDSPPTDRVDATIVELYPSVGSLLKSCVQPAAASTPCGSVTIETDVISVHKENSLAKIPRPRTLAARRMRVAATYVHGAGRAPRTVSAQLVYRLGDAAHFRTYTNHYATNPHALSRAQLAEERDRRRALSHKFAVGGQTDISLGAKDVIGADFSWALQPGIDVFSGLQVDLVDVLRVTLTVLESCVSFAFMQSHWKTRRRVEWLRTVQECETPQQFGAALSAFEAHLMPRVLVSHYFDGLGHCRLIRLTEAARDAEKKRRTAANTQRGGLLNVTVSGVTSVGNVGAPAGAKGTRRSAAAKNQAAAFDSLYKPRGALVQSVQGKVRGRPRKPLLAEQSQIGSADSGTPPSSSRRRGRPPKRVGKTDTEAEPQSQSQADADTTEPASHATDDESTNQDLTGVDGATATKLGEGALPDANSSVAGNPAETTNQQPDAAEQEATAVLTKVVNPIRHTLWRVKGEEYRRYAGQGWYWVAVTRTSRPVDASRRGLALLRRTTEQSQSTEAVENPAEEMQTRTRDAVRVPAANRLDRLLAYREAELTRKRERSERLQTESRALNAAFARVHHSYERLDAYVVALRELARVIEAEHNASVPLNECDSVRAALASRGFVQLDEAEYDFLLKLFAKLLRSSSSASSTNDAEKRTELRAMSSVDLDSLTLTVCSQFGVLDALARNVEPLDSLLVDVKRAVLRSQRILSRCYSPTCRLFETCGTRPCSLTAIEQPQQNVEAEANVDQNVDKEASEAIAAMQRDDDPALNLPIVLNVTGCTDIDAARRYRCYASMCDRDAASYEPTDTTNSSSITLGELLDKVTETSVVKADTLLYFIYRVRAEIIDRLHRLESERSVDDPSNELELETQTRHRHPLKPPSGWASTSRQSDKSTPAPASPAERAELPHPVWIWSFSTRRQPTRSSVFLLPSPILTRLSRCGGQREVLDFSYAMRSKAVMGWPYEAGRPSFRTMWRLRTATARSFAAIALQLRTLWACLRWDELRNAHAKHEAAAEWRLRVGDIELEARRIVERRPLDDFHLQFEYRVEHVLIPVEWAMQNTSEIEPVPSTTSGRKTAGSRAANRKDDYDYGSADSDEDYEPMARKLRKRRTAHGPSLTSPTIHRFWSNELNVELWEVKRFFDTHAKQLLAASKKEDAKAALKPASEPNAAADSSCVVEGADKPATSVSEFLQKLLSTPKLRATFLTTGDVQFPAHIAQKMPPDLAPLVCDVRSVLESWQAMRTAQYHDKRDAELRIERTSDSLCYRLSFANLPAQKRPASTTSASRKAAVSSVAGKPGGEEEESHDLSDDLLNAIVSEAIVTLEEHDKRDETNEDVHEKLLMIRKRVRQRIVRAQRVALQVKQAEAAMHAKAAAAASASHGQTLKLSVTNANAGQKTNVQAAAPALAGRQSVQQTVALRPQNVNRNQPAPASVLVPGSAASATIIRIHPNDVRMRNGTAAGIQKTAPAVIAVRPATPQVAKLQPQPAAAAAAAAQSPQSNSLAEQLRFRMLAQQRARVLQALDRRCAEMRRAFQRKRELTFSALRIESTDEACTVKYMRERAQLEQLMEEERVQAEQERIRRSLEHASASKRWKASAIGNAHGDLYAFAPPGATADQELVMMGAAAEDELLLGAALSLDSVDVKAGNAVPLKTANVNEFIGSRSSNAAEFKPKSKAKMKSTDVSEPHKRGAHPKTQKADRRNEGRLSDPVKTEPRMDDLQMLAAAAAVPQSGERERNKWKMKVKIGAVPQLNRHTKREREREPASLSFADRDELDNEDSPHAERKHKTGQHRHHKHKHDRDQEDQQPQPQQQQQPQPEKHQEQLPQPQEASASVEVDNGSTKPVQPVSSDRERLPAAASVDRRSGAASDVKLPLPAPVVATAIFGNRKRKATIDTIADAAAKAESAATTPTASNSKKRDSSIGLTSKKQRLSTNASSKQKKSASSNQQLYCLCQTPYDDTAFYIGCDHCNDWFHGSCVGVSAEEANNIDTYMCPRCRKANPESTKSVKSSSDTRLNVSSSNVTSDAIHMDTPLNSKNKDVLKRLLRNISNHRCSWPFNEPVDAKIVPDYYAVIRHPTDLLTISRKLDNSQYSYVGEVLDEVALMFANCRAYNAPHSDVRKLGDTLEQFYNEQIQKLSDRLTKG